MQTRLGERRALCAAAQWLEVGAAVDGDIGGAPLLNVLRRGRLVEPPSHVEKKRDGKRSDPEIKLAAQ